MESLLLVLVSLRSLQALLRHVSCISVPVPVLARHGAKLHSVHPSAV